MFWLKLLRDIIDVFREGASPHQIAGGFVLGFIIGLTPGWPLHVFALCLLLFLLNVNLGIASAAAMLAVVLAWLLDPLLDTVGYWVLKDIAALQDLWTMMYNNSILRLTRFNNTLVMGALVVGTALAPLWYFLVYKFISQYRQQIVESINRWRIVRWVRGSRVMGFLFRVEEVL